MLEEFWGRGMNSIKHSVAVAVTVTVTLKSHKKQQNSETILYIVKPSLGSSQVIIEGSKNPPQMVAEWSLDRAPPLPKQKQQKANRVIENQKPMRLIR